MNHASLFSGIGGAEIAAEWMGWENVFHVEINPFGRKILEYWYPNSISYEDITKMDFTRWRGKIDVLTAGFPCQPFSLAGHRKGADDDRYLWPQVVRAVHEIRPAWVVGENVAGILTMVQPGEEVEVGSGASLFGEDYRKRVLLRQEYVIETVCRDLEREGYEVRPFVIPACAVGAPHRRDRVWIVAHRADAGAETVQCGREDGVCPVIHASHADIDRYREREDKYVAVDGCKGASNDSTCGKNGTSSIPGSQRCDNGCDNRGMRQVRDDRERNAEESKPERNERERRACKDGTTTTYTQCRGGREIHNEVQPGQPNGQRAYGNGCERFVTHTDNKLSQCGNYSEQEGRDIKRNRVEPPHSPTGWADFPTQSPVRMRYDGISNNVVRYIKQEVYDAIKEHIRREDLPHMWKAFQKKEVREKIGRLYEIPEPDLLLEILQRTSEEGRSPKEQGVFHRLAREHLKECCDICGSTEHLQVHHLDRNIKNNSPSNLRTLCQSCHMKLHWQLRRLLKNANQLQIGGDKNP